MDSCIKNCVRSKYNDQQLVHYKSVCSTCSRSPALKYVWHAVDGESATPPIVVGTNQARLVLDSPLLAAIHRSDRLTITVTVTDAMQTIGRASVHLWRHSKPTVKCQIQPKPPASADDGIAGETVYLVQCDRNEFHRFTVYQGDQLIAHSDSAPFECRLLDTAQHSARIRIVAIDLANAETSAIVGEQTLTVRPNARPLETVAQMLDFLVGPHPLSVRSVSQAGKIETAIVLLHILIGNLTPERWTRAERGHIVGVALSGIMRDIALPGPAEKVRMFVDVTAALTTATVVDLDHELALNACQVLFRAVSALSVLQAEAEFGRFHLEDQLLANIAQILSIIQRVIEPVDRLEQIWTDEQIPMPIYRPYLEHYPDYGELNETILIVLENRLQTTQHILKIVTVLSGILKRQCRPMEPQIDIALEKLMLKHVESEPGEGTIAVVVGHDETIELSVEIEDISHGHSTTACVFRSDPMWWYPAPFPINSDVVIVDVLPSSPHSELAFRADRTSTAPRAIHLKFRMPTPEIQPTEASVTNSDSDMSVYGIRVPANGVLRVSFRLQAGVALRVHFTWNDRATHYEFVRACRTIRAESGAGSQLRTLRWPNEHATSRVLYMAIMAGADSTADAEGFIDFQFWTTVAACSSWSRHDWIALDCRLGADYADDDAHLHCVCQQSAEAGGAIAYASQLYVAPNQLYLPRDLRLALVDNWLVLGFVLVLLAVIVGALFWARLADRRTKNTRHLPPLLIDSAPAVEECLNDSANVRDAQQQQHFYLITIYTGIGPNAGTTARICIRVHGTNHTTGTLPMTASSATPRKPNGNDSDDAGSTPDDLFVRGSVLYFRLCTARRLGPLLAITLSHNSAGRQPSWFCDWVRVQDMRQPLDDWIFLVRRWLSLALLDADDDDKSPKNRPAAAQCICPPIGDREYNSRWLRFRMQLRQLLATRSVWYGLVLPHNSNSSSTAAAATEPMTRTQRVGVAAVSLVCSLLTNAMFFGRTTDATVEREKQQKYARLTASVRLVVVAVQCAIIALILTWAVNFLLSWSRNRKYKKAASDTRDEERSPVIVTV